MAIQGHLFDVDEKLLGDYIIRQFWSHISNFERYSDRKKEKWQFSTAPLSFDAPSIEHHKYRRNPYILTN